MVLTEAQKRAMTIYKAKNAEKLTIYKKNYYLTNRDRLLAYQAKYRIEHK